MNRKISLTEKFRDYLYSRYSSKKELVSVLSNILNMETGSVSRRLDGKVLFTVDEIGVIADKLDISIDSLLNSKALSIPASLNLITPLKEDTVQNFFEYIHHTKDRIEETSDKPLQIGYIFNSLPLEFCKPYKHLYKFINFKWEYHLINNNLNMNYAQWQISPHVKIVHDELTGFSDKAESIFYIWDNSVIWNLIKDIELFYKLMIVNDDDVSFIKKDLHDMLHNIEMSVNNINIEDNKEQKKNVDLYISSINIGVTCICFYSEECFQINYIMPFAWLEFQRNSTDFDKVYKWVNSMKKVATLISGSGALDRRIFFEEQHRTIDRTL